MNSFLTLMIIRFITSLQPTAYQFLPSISSGPAKGRISDMPHFKEGDRVRVINRPVTDSDRLSNAYFEHMAGLIGTVQNIYGREGIAVKVEVDSLSRVTSDVHRESTKRMREKFLNNISEEQKKQLTAQELNFDAHYVLLVREEDLEKA